MCDTFVALPGATSTGGVLLAKNADTEINEAQHLLKLPRQDHPDGALVRLTHLVIPQARRTHEVLLDKSFWLFGGEIGVNEHGVAVGNEAVFSNRASDRDGVILIDLLRLILERSATRRSISSPSCWPSTARAAIASSAATAISTAASSSAIATAPW